jgi:hypothetical protein
LTKSRKHPRYAKPSGNPTMGSSLNYQPALDQIKVDLKSAGSQSFGVLIVSYYNDAD